MSNLNTHLKARQLNISHFLSKSHAIATNFQTMKQ